jgi:hypothetical protein
MARFIGVEPSSAPAALLRSNQLLGQNGCCQGQMAAVKKVSRLMHYHVGVEKVGAAFERFGDWILQESHSVLPLPVPMQWQVPVASLAG